MKLKTGADSTRGSTPRTPAAPRSTEWAPLSASARPSGLTSIRRRSLPVGPDDYKKIDPEKLAVNSKSICARSIAAASG